MYSDRDQIFNQINILVNLYREERLLLSGKIRLRRLCEEAYDEPTASLSLRIDNFRSHLDAMVDEFYQNRRNHDLSLLLVP